MDSKDCRCVTLQDLLGFSRRVTSNFAQELSIHSPVGQAGAAESHMVKLEQGPRVLPTKWTKEVNSSSPWPEYPRPQLRRPHWKSLNGKWEFDFALCAFSACSAGLFASEVVWAAVHGCSAEKIIRLGNHPSECPHGF